MSSKIIIFILLSVISNYLILDIDLIDIIILSIFIIFSFEMHSKKIVFEQNLIFFISILYIYLSHLTLPFFVYLDLIKYNENLIVNAHRLGMIYILIGYLIKILKFYNSKPIKIKELKNKESIFTSYPQETIIIFFIIIFSFSLISQILGIGKMGNVTVNLPFKLTGIINYSRMVFFPYIFVILFDKFKNKNLIRSKERIILIIYISWCLYECYVRLSRSALIEYMMPISLYYIISLKLNVNKIIKYSFILILINILLYPIITNLRNDSTIISTNKNDGDNERIWKRTFSNSFFYEKYHKYIDDQLINTNYSKAIIIEGGSHNFTTNVVDNLRSISDTHNSGTTGLMDAYLFGGVLFSIFIAYISFSLAIHYDISWLTNKPLEFAFGFTLVKWLIWHRSISLIFTPMDLSVLIILFFIVRNK